jgi:hypothetical protein
MIAAIGHTDRRPVGLIPGALLKDLNSFRIPTMSTRTAFGCLLAMSACLTLGIVAESSAAAITWMYSGSINSSFNETLVPVGSAATIFLTVDPDANFMAGAPWAQPNMGGYYFSANISFTGREYVLRGAYEVNWDLSVNYPLPGLMPVREFSLSGPSLDPNAPGFSYRPQLPSCYGGGPCYWEAGRADPTSSAFPGPFAFFRLYFNDPNSTAFPGLGLITVGGRDPQVVPEPSTLLLLSSSVLALLAARLRKRGA